MSCRFLMGIYLLEENILRKELKFLVSSHQAKLLKQLLKCFCNPDPYGESYQVTSIYFDTLDNKALHDKLSGHNRLGKVRLRFYNQDKTALKLELKTKKGDWVVKESRACTKDEAENYIERPSLINDCFPISERHLIAKTAITYARTAFEYRGMKVRLTIDEHIGISTHRPHLTGDCLYANVSYDAAIFEIKYSEGLPVHLIKLLSDMGLRESLSKYAIARTMI